MIHFDISDLHWIDKDDGKPVPNQLVCIQHDVRYPMNDTHYILAEIDETQTFYEWIPKSNGNTKHVCRVYHDEITAWAYYFK